MSNSPIICLFCITAGGGKHFFMVDTEDYWPLYAGYVDDDKLDSTWKKLNELKRNQTPVSYDDIATIIPEHNYPKE